MYRPREGQAQKTPRTPSSEAASERQKVQQQDNSGNRSPTAGGKKNGGKKPPKKSAGDSGGAGATGNVFATMAVAKKRAAPVRGMKRMLSFVMAWIAPLMLCCSCQCVDMRHVCVRVPLSAV